MKTRAAALALMALVVFPAVAPGKAKPKTKTLKGKIGAVSNARISLKVTYDKKGNPVKVSKIKITRLAYRCPATGVKGEANIAYPGSIAVKYSRATKKYSFKGTQTVKGQKVRLFGPFYSPKYIFQGGIDLDFTLNGASCANGAASFTAK